ncbi:MAG: DUF5916 domain-containing protein [Anaeromyxobacteraceae bacterium]
MLSGAASAAEPDPVVARRATGEIHLDGRLDEPDWAEAPVFSRFVESFPQAGAPASLPTELRVVFDDTTLYVAVTCSDPAPDRIIRQLARRDTDTTSDRVEVAIDPGAGGRTAYVFVVNAAGVLRDALLFGDVNTTDSWDAVWDAAVHVGEQGWGAELAIPFRSLRLGEDAGQAWGFVVRRHVPRTHQVFGSTLVPQEANPRKPGELVVSRLGRLEGLAGVDPPRPLELLPYVAARGILRPQYSDPARPNPRLVDPILDVGLDLKLPLTRRLTLTGAVNPDFGQVETDEVIQNLSTFEQFFPEKRPFFLEGLDIFQPVGFEYGTQQQLFYSRRVGLDAPILAAAKLTGNAGPGLEVGVLDSVVMGAASDSPEDDPDRRWRLHARQPFRFGPEDAFPAERPVTTNYFAAVARKKLAGDLSAGVTVAAATPLEQRCYEGAGCGVTGANALALDLNDAGEWGGFGQLSLSQAVGGGSAGRTLRDGTVLHSGDLGLGGHMRWGKLRGEPWRFDVQYVYQPPKLDLNRIGFQPFADYQWADLNLHYVRPNGIGPFHAFQVDYNLDLNWTADGRLPRGVNTNVYSSLQLPGYQKIGVRVALEVLQYDAREIVRAGVPFERTSDGWVALVLASDPHQALQANGDVFLIRTIGAGPFTAKTGWGWDLAASWRPHPRLETRLEGAYGLKPQGPRWIETLGDGTAVFGVQDPEFLSLTLRQQLVFTPRLTAQLYVQFFSQAIRWGSTFYGASIVGRRDLSHSDLVPITYDKDPSAHDAVVNVNAVLRWEYRLGSTIYVVYTRSQSELPPPGDRAPPDGIGTPELFRGPKVDSFMVKWTWWRGG